MQTKYLRSASSKEATTESNFLPMKNQEDITEWSWKAFATRQGAVVPATTGKKIVKKSLAANHQKFYTLYFQKTGTKESN